MTPSQDWRVKLRDLYLIENPDSKGLHTSSITFEFGRFQFTPKEKWGKSAFYLVDKESLESFIESLITAAEQRGKPNVGMLRQWLNEDRKCTPMVTNEDIEYWLAVARSNSKEHE